MSRSAVRIGGVLAAAAMLATVGWMGVAAAQDGPPPPPGDVRGAVDDLNLSADQRAEVDPLVADLQRQQRQARDAFLQKAKPILSADQYQRLAAELAHDGPRGERHDDSDAEAKPATPVAPLPPLAAGERRVAVTFTGGHDTDGRDGGRPVTLVAAGMGVPADVFRQTFTHVHPAGPDRGGPTDAEARQNKRALLDGLSKYGVTDDRINAVSNYYRYVRSHGEMWRHRDATASAVVRDGRVVRFDVTDAGAGYTTPPKVSVDGVPNVTATVTLSFGTDLPTNGSIQQIVIR